MRKLKFIGLFLSILLLNTSCGLQKNTLENANIYATVYPVKYITEYLYGENSTVSSIYPNDVDLQTYKLTEKQTKQYAQGDLFVYIGVSNEKEISKSFINENNEILIIDATHGLSETKNIKELWLAPNNFLMLVKNIKSSLIEYLNNPLKEEEINKKYDELYSSISWIDAELRNIAKEAGENGNNTLVVSTNNFKFFEHYGFNVISLEDLEKESNENALNDLKNRFKTSKYSNIIKLSSEEDSDLMKELAEKYNATIVSINDVTTNSDPSSDYLAIQHENIALIRNLLAE